MERDQKKKYSQEFVCRFWKKANRVDNESCWEWQGAVQSKGYGSVGIGNGRTALAHRVAYEIYHGEIPEGMHVLHKCDNKICVNPRHLFLGSNKDNVADKVKKGRQAKGEKNGRSKLTYKQVEEIRKAYMEGNNPYDQIALRFGVSYSTIRKVVKGEYWKLPLAE